MHTLYPDVYLTRRQRLHYVMDGDGVLMWSGKSLTSALEYLLSAGQNEFRIEGQDESDCFKITGARALKTQLHHD